MPYNGLSQRYDPVHGPGEPGPASRVQLWHRRGPLSPSGRQVLASAASSSAMLTTLGLYRTPGDSAEPFVIHPFPPRPRFCRPRNNTSPAPPKMRGARVLDSARRPRRRRVSRRDALKPKLIFGQEVAACNRTLLPDSRAVSRDVGFLGACEQRRPL